MQKKNSLITNQGSHSKVIGSKKIQSFSFLKMDSFNQAAKAYSHLGPGSANVKSWSLKMTT